MIKGFIYLSFIIFLWITTTTATILSILAPFLEYQRIPFAQSIYRILRSLCHQIPSRCFWIWDSNLGLCSRCFCLFAAFSLVLPFLFFFNKKFKKKYILWPSIVLILPILIDGTISTLTRHISNNITRSITGTLCGVGFCLIFLVRREVN